MIFHMQLEEPGKLTNGVVAEMVTFRKRRGIPWKKFGIWLANLLQDFNPEIPIEQILRRQAEEVVQRKGKLSRNKQKEETEQEKGARMHHKLAEVNVRNVSKRMKRRDEKIADIQKQIKGQKKIESKLEKAVISDTDPSPLSPQKERRITTKNV